MGYDCLYTHIDGYNNMEWFAIVFFVVDGWIHRMSHCVGMSDTRRLHRVASATDPGVGHVHVYRAAAYRSADTLRAIVHRSIEALDWVTVRYGK